MLGDWIGFLVVGQITLKLTDSKPYSFVVSHGQESRGLGRRHDWISQEAAVRLWAGVVAITWRLDRGLLGLETDFKDGLFT